VVIGILIGIGQGKDKGKGKDKVNRALFKNRVP
jgi:hypothetical protein